MNSIGYIDIPFSEIEKYLADVSRKEHCKVMPRGRFRLGNEVIYSGLVCHPNDMDGKATGISASVCDNCDNRSYKEIIDEVIKNTEDAGKKITCCHYFGNVRHVDGKRTCANCGIEEPDLKFEKWLNDFCIDNFHYSYDALVNLSKIDGKVVKILVTAIQEYYENSKEK